MYLKILKTSQLHNCTYIAPHQEFIMEERGEYPTLHICRRPSLARVRDLSALLVHKCETAFATENQHSTQLVVITWPSMLMYMWLHIFSSPHAYLDMFIYNVLMNFVQGWYTSGTLSSLFLLCTLAPTPPIISYHLQLMPSDPTCSTTSWCSFAFSSSSFCIFSRAFNMPSWNLSAFTGSKFSSSILSSLLFIHRCTLGLMLAQTMNSTIAISRMYQP